MAAAEKSLYEQGYRVRIVWTPGRQRVMVGLFDVRKSDGTVYRVNMNNLVCSCEARKVCKHIEQMQALLLDCATYWEGLAKANVTNRQRNCDLAWNLETAVNRLWGNQEREFCGQVYHAAELSSAPRLCPVQIPSAEADPHGYFADWRGAMQEAA